MQDPITPNTPSPKIDYPKIRRAMRDLHEREALGEFIKAGWTAAEFAEYARHYFRLPGKTRPTAASYRFAMLGGPNSEIAQAGLKQLRAPGFVMPPLDRPIARHELEVPNNP